MNTSESSVGKVVTDAELAATTAKSWNEVEAHILTNVRTFIPESLRELYTPSSSKLKTLLNSIVSANISEPAFGGKEKSKFCVALLLGNISKLGSFTQLSS